MSNALDQRMKISEEDKEIFRTVETKVHSAILHGDPSIAFDHGKELGRKAMLNGVAVAKLMWELSTKWNLFNIDETFENEVLAQWGYSPATTMKYVRMWEQTFNNPDVPEYIKDSLYGHPINNLMALGPALSEGLLSEDEMERAAKAHDLKTLKDVIKGAGGGSGTSAKTAIWITIEGNGDITAYQDGERFPLGYLDMQTEEIPPFAQKAIDRIIRESDIREKA